MFYGFGILAESVQHDSLIGCGIMNKRAEIILDRLQVTIISLIVVIIIENFVLSFAIVKGESMSPTLSTRDRLLVIKVPYICEQFNKGDLVVFNPPDSLEQNEMFIKRVIAKGNDHFLIQEGVLYINGEVQKEGYISTEGYLTRNYNYVEGTVPPDMCFVMGDNRNNSNDSRSFGFVPKDKIRAKVLLKVWPLNELRAFMN